MRQWNQATTTNACYAERWSRYVLRYRVEEVRIERHLSLKVVGECCPFYSFMVPWFRARMCWDKFQEQEGTAS